MAKNKDNAVPHYEMLYIVSNQYTEEEAKTIAGNTEKSIEKQGGTVTYKEEWGKKKFTHPVKSQHYGYYFLVEFDLPGDKANALNREFELDNEILRHMLVSKKARSLEEIQAEKRAEEQRVRERIEEAEAIEANEAKKDVEAEKAKEKKPIDLKDLDEKLDKILDTDDLL